MMRKDKRKAIRFEPIVMETFSEPHQYAIKNMKQDCPSCFNGIVEVRKYRITVELIDEPNEVIAARIQALWDNCDNHHHWDPLRFAAKEIGYELQGNHGNKLREAK